MDKTVKKKEYKILKILIFIIFILLMIGLTIKIMPYFAQISTSEGREILKEKISNLGIYGILVIVGLIVAQIFFMFLPGEPVELLAGMCYGSIGGLFVVYLGVFISSCLIILLVRKFGRNFIYTFVSKEKIEKLENSKLFKTKNLDMVLIILFAIPGTPKDIMTYIGAFLPIKPLKFIIISTLARFPSILTSTMAGSNIIDGNWLIVGAVYLITIILSFITIYLLNKRKNLIISK